MGRGKFESEKEKREKVTTEWLQSHTHTWVGAERGKREEGGLAIQCQC